MGHVELFTTLWAHYSSYTPSASKIHELLKKHGEEEVLNDHVAFRTFNLDKVNVDVLGKHFIDLGYKECDTYDFEVKKLNAKHFEHTSDNSAPKVFISELKTELFSEYTQDIISQCVNEVSLELVNSHKILSAGRPWKNISYKIYEKLLKESEYAAWMYVFGFCVNHFTVNVNALETIDNLIDFNTLLKDHGWKLNSSGGEIKGSVNDYLEQSSILADHCEVDFEEGRYTIPSCYYEFAKRYTDKSGKLFQGFVAKSADKIFESTNTK